MRVLVESLLEFSLDFVVNPSEKGTKKGQATYIAPLQPPTLAIFRSWGNLEGAGRVRLTPITNVLFFSLLPKES